MFVAEHGEDAFDDGGHLAALAACRTAARADVTGLSDDELLAAAAAWEQARAALDAAQGHVLAELETRDVCDREAGLPTVAWLAHQAHLARPTAAGRVHTATKLRRLDLTDEALAAGSITFDHARVLARAAANPRITDQVIAAQTELIDLAGRLLFGHWQRCVARLVDSWDQDGGYDPTRDLARNHLRLSDLGDTTVLAGDLVGETALTIRQAIETETDRLWRRYHTDHDQTPDLEIPTRSTLQALALADICRRAQGHEPGHAPTTDLTLIAEIDPTEPTTITSLSTRNGVPLDPNHYPHLLCDPIFHPLLVDHQRIPLDLGRSVRLASPGQRRALAIRDRGCVFPGCDRPPDWCDAHHLTRYQPDGATDLHNLALLCRHHHGITHRNGWTMHTTSHNTFTWTTPTGHTLTNHHQPGTARAA